MKMKAVPLVVLIVIGTIFALTLSRIRSKSLDVTSEEETMTCVEIASLNLNLYLPIGMSEIGGKESGVAIYCFEEELMNRHTRCLSIMRVSDNDEDFNVWPSVPVQNNGSFYYTISEVDVGSGDPEVILKGYLQLDQNIYKVTANAQAQPDATGIEWAISAIQTANLINRPSSSTSSACNEN